MGNSINNMYYIGYLTTNLSNKKIYIGIHKTENPYKFDGYLGCGVWETKPSSYMHPKEAFQRAVKKYGPKNFIRVTLQVFDSLKDAQDFERFMVNEEFVARPDTYNVALGGGYPPQTASKTIYQYSLEGKFIKEFSSIAEAALEYKCKSSTIGTAIFNGVPALKYLWADYKEEQLDIKDFKIDRNKKPIYIYDLEGNYIRSFKSVKEGATFYNIDNAFLSNACMGKFIICKSYYVSFTKYEKFPIPKKLSSKNSKIYQYDLSGKFIKEWNTYNDIKDFFGKDLSIYASIRLGGTAGGYQWSLDKVPAMKNYELQPHKTEARKVGKYDLNDNLICIFDSVREAKKDTCGAPGVLRGNRKTAGGFKWKYVDNTKDIV